MNTFKTGFLLTALTLLFVFVGSLIGGNSGMITAFIFALVMNFSMYWFSDKIVLAMYRAKPISETDDPELYKIVSKLCQNAILPMPKLYRISMNVPNAFATGRNPNHAAVCVTDAIVKLLSRDELTGVLAHELAHIKNRDTLIQTMTATITGAIYMLANMARWGAMFGGRDRENRGGAGLQLAVILIVSVLAPICAMLIQLAVSRSREYIADATGAKIANDSNGLANALLKLQEKSSIVHQEVNPTTAHLFIVNPLSAKGIAGLFSTHPPIQERVKRLREMK